MIKEKFLKVLLWFRDHFRFLLEVVIRLSLGIEKKQINQENNSSNEDRAERSQENDSTTD